MIEWISPDIGQLVHLQELNISRNGTVLQSSLADENPVPA